MNRSLFGILAILTLSLSIIVPITSAQTLARANVPFAFTVGQTELPAGTYLVSTVSDSAIVITNRKTATSVISLFRSEQSDANDGTAKFVFHKYGERYFLSQVGRGSGTNLLQLPTSKLEKEAQSQTAHSVSQKEVVVGAK